MMSVRLEWSTALATHISLAKPGEELADGQKADPGLYALVIGSQVIEGTLVELDDLLWGAVDLVRFRS